MRALLLGLILFPALGACGEAAVCGTTVVGLWILLIVAFVRWWSRLPRPPDDDDREDGWGL